MVHVGSRRTARQTCSTTEELAGAGNGALTALDPIETTGFARPLSGNYVSMSEARTPEDDTIETGEKGEPEQREAEDDAYVGPDPEDDQKGDGSDEDQGT